MSSGTVTAFAPGRVNLLGEHTDYNGGLALPFAIERGVTVRATTLPGPLLMARAREPRETDVFDAAHPGDPRAVSGWRAFVRGTAAELAAAGHTVRAARIEVSGDVPQGGGLSSSAALGVASALALLGIAGVEDPDRRELARTCSRVEERWLGAPTGLLDQYAALLAVEGHALLIDFAADAVEPVPLELGGWTFAVVPTGVRRDVAASGYGHRRRECAEAAEQLGVAHLSHAEREKVEALEEPWRSRALHVLAEDDRVRAAVECMRRGDAGALGALLDASHESLRGLFAASTPEVDRVVERCRERGAAGARMIGGGFGGHVLALVPPDAPPLRGAFTVRPSGPARCW